MKLIGLAAGFVALLCSLNCSHAQSLEMTGSIGLEFTEIATNVWQFNNMNANLDLGVPVSVPISIKTWLPSQPAFYWNDVGNWDNPTLALANSVVLTETTFNMLTGNPGAILQLPGAVDVLINGGPTERSISVAGLVLSSNIPGWSASVSASAVLKFDVTIPSGRGVIMNQAATIQNLKVEGGASLSGNSGMHVRENLDVDGAMYDLAGEVNGDISISGETVQTGSLWGFQNFSLHDGTHIINNASLVLNEILGNGTIRFQEGSSGNLWVTNEIPSLPSGVSVHGGHGMLSWPAEKRFLCIGDIIADNPGYITLRGLWTRVGGLVAENGGNLTLGGNWENRSAAGIATSSGCDVYFEDSSSVELVEPLHLAGESNSFHVGSGAIFRNGSLSGAPLERGELLTLDNVTLGADLYGGGVNPRIFVTNGLVCNATISLPSALVLQNSSTLSGNGTIRFAPSGLIEGDGNVAIGSGIMVRGGQGDIRTTGGTLSLFGTVVAETPDYWVGINNSWVNRGTLRAEAGGNLALGGHWENRSTASIAASSGGRVVFADSSSVELVEPLHLAGEPNSFYVGSGTIFRNGSLSGAPLERSELLTLDNVTLGSDLYGAYGPHHRIIVTNGLVCNATISLTSALVLQNSSTLSGNGTIRFAPSGLIEGDGNVAIGSGIMVRGGQGDIRTTGGTLSLFGTVVAETPDCWLTIADLWVNRGTLRAENGGNLVLEGTWTNHGAVICMPSSSRIYANNYYCSGTATSRFHISSASTSSVAPLSISGDAKLDGALDVLCVDGFRPSLGNSFELLSAAGGIAGTRFSVTNLPTLAAGLAWRVEYGDTSVWARIVETSEPTATITPSYPYDCAPMTVTFNASTSVLAQAATVFAVYRFSTNDHDWASSPMERMGSNTFRQVFAPNQIPDNAPQLEIVFSDGGSHQENNGGINWKAPIRDCDSPSGPAGVELSPSDPNGCDPVTVRYYPNDGVLKNDAVVQIHIGRNGWQDVIAPDPAMVRIGPYWEYTYGLPTNTVQIDVAFNNGTGVWDNNNGNDWKVAVTNCGTISAVSMSPANANACEPFTIIYNPAERNLLGANPVYIHVGRNGWLDVVDPDPAMTPSGSLWTYRYNPAVGTTNINIVFNNGAGTWDNNDGADWHLDIEDCLALPPHVSNVGQLPAGAGFRLSLDQSIPNARYAIYSSPTLIPSQSWQAVVGSIQTGTGLGIDLTITNGLLPLNYFRVGYTLP